MQMTELTKKRKGRWVSGQSGNPQGRKVGTGEIAKLRASISSQMPEMLAAMISRALQGDVAACRLILERTLAPLRPVEQAVTMEMPNGVSLTEKAAFVLSAAAAGVLAPGQASQLIGALGAIAKIIEIDTLIGRIEKLEATHGNAKSPGWDT
jgi:hypothetical protein